MGRRGIRGEPQGGQSVGQARVGVAASDKEMRQLIVGLEESRIRTQRLLEVPGGLIELVLPDQQPRQQIMSHRMSGEQLERLVEQGRRLGVFSFSEEGSAQSEKRLGKAGADLQGESEFGFGFVNPAFFQKRGAQDVVRQIIPGGDAQARGGRGPRCSSNEATEARSSPCRQAREAAARTPRATRR